MKKDIKRSKRETNIHEAGGSSEGAGLEPDVPNEQKGKSTNISKGTSLILGVLDMSKEDSSKSEYESWGDSDDDNDDDDQQGNDEQNVSDNSRTSDNEEETQENEFVYTPENYVPTNDEEYKCINKEMYDDVNVELKDAKTADERKDDEEMTDAEKIDAKNENINQEVIGDQVNDDAQAIVTAALATQKTKVPLQIQHEDPSSQTSPLLTIPVLIILESLTTPTTTIPLPIPPFIPLPQQSTPIPTPTTTEATISTTYAPNSSTLTAIHQRLFDLENEVKTLKNVDHGSAIRAAIKSKVPIIIKEYLGTSLDDTLHK
ncbi:hypothetical protein Tco_1455057, partial [Tanacetum coccineum]